MIDDLHSVLQSWDIGLVVGLDFLGLVGLTKVRTRSLVFLNILIESGERYYAARNVYDSDET